MKIYLIRHGESTSDVKEKYEGDYDDHLTKKGLNEARILADKLPINKIQTIFTSSKIRAQETTKIIGSVLKCKKITVLDGLNEQDIYGAYPELGKNQPEEEYRRLGEVLTNRSEIVESVETYSHFKKRIIDCFSGILNDDYNTIAIVTHGGPIRCIFRDILKKGEFKKINNGTIIELEKRNLNLRVISIDGAVLQ